MKKLFTNLKQILLNKIANKFIAQQQIILERMETLLNDQADIISSQNIEINSLTSELKVLRIELATKTTLVESQSNLLTKYQRHLEFKNA